MQPRDPRRSVIQRSPNAVSSSPAISLPPTLQDQRILSEDHAKHFIQHGAEGRNPYETIVAKLEGLPVICISALGAKKDAFGEPLSYTDKDFSPLLKSGKITEGGLTVQACLPYEFVAAAAIVAAKLGGPDSVVTSRVTRWSQDSIPNAPKPPTTKLKTGKGGISGGVIPVDLETTTNEGPGGTLLALKQNPDHRPNLEEEKNITTVQWAKPLDQVIVGLDKQPPDFILCTSKDAIQKTGLLEFKMNCTDNGIDQAIYRIDLRQESREPSKTTVKPLNSKEPTVQEPPWWNADFGPFAEKTRDAYHVDYKKTENQPEYRPYEVYARLSQDGEKLPLSGDQDLFFIPRSEKYALGALATEVVDTHAENGVEHLVDKMKEVHRQILKKDLGTGEIKVADLQGSMDQFNHFLNSSHDYLHALGTLTPYEAYFIIHLNNQIAKIKEIYHTDPEGLSDLVRQVQVDKSIGLTSLKTMDIDLNTAWFKEKPQEMSKRVEAHLEKGFHVSPEILELQIAQPTQQQSAFSNTDLLNTLRAKAHDLALQHASDWKMYAKVEIRTPPPILPGQVLPPPPYYHWQAVTKEHPVAPEKITALLIDATASSKRGVISIDNTGIKSTLDDTLMKALIPEADSGLSLTLK